MSSTPTGPPTTWSPPGGLYPHQWSWDAAFIAIGLAYVNPTRAWRDLRSLFEAQWPDGRVPHIVFDPATAEDDYFPGPGFWDVPAYGGRPARGSTGLVQPPLHAVAAWEVYRRAAAHGAACAREAGARARLALSAPGRPAGVSDRSPRRRRRRAGEHRAPVGVGPGQQPLLGHGHGGRAGRSDAARPLPAPGHRGTRTRRTGPPTWTTPGTSVWCSTTATAATRTPTWRDRHALRGRVPVVQLDPRGGRAGSGPDRRGRRGRPRAAPASGRSGSPRPSPRACSTRATRTFHARDVRTGRSARPGASTA